LPWGLEIAPQHRPVGYEQYSTFQPTFLYECCTNLLSYLFIVFLEKRFRLRNLQSMWLFVALSTFFRFFYENMRTDNAHHIGPLRVNAWVALILFVVSVIAFIWQGKHGKPQGRVDGPADTAAESDAVPEIDPVAPSGPEPESP